MITLVSSDGKQAKIRTGYKLKKGYVEVARDRLRMLGKQRNFTPSECWAKAQTVDGDMLVKGVGVSTSSTGGFEW